ncbi:hypothetical protein [Amycolatopsis sp. WAC 01375]|uniref:hypothetical protein n=1 Tax=Amycolatopsis sp. WAC 01375 TaxID=2203194 RepID=UPI000F78AC4D|nr:hypothetical protein [Amycolatopsis sp. WAC 01375]
MSDLVMRWWAEVDGDSAAYDERSADRVDVFTEAGDHVCTLYRESSGRWADVHPADVTRATILWSDVAAYVSDPDGVGLG